MADYRKIVSVNFTPAEYDAVAEAAKDAGQPIATYIRAKCRGEHPNVRSENPEWHRFHCPCGNEHPDAHQKCPRKLGDPGCKHGTCRPCDEAREATVERKGLNRAKCGGYLGYVAPEYRQPAERPIEHDERGKTKDLAISLGFEKDKAT